MPNHAHKPSEATRRQVEAMSAYGIRECDISAVLDIVPKTLRKYYRVELDTGHVKANSRIAESLYKSALNGNTTAQIFWLKTRARWSESSHLQLSANVALSHEESLALLA